MPINTDIYSKIATPEIPNLLAAYAEGRQAKQQSANAAMQNRLLQYQLQKAQDEDADAKRLSAAIGGSLNPDGTINWAGASSYLAKNDGGKQIPAIAKLQRDDQNSRLEWQTNVAKLQDQSANSVIADPRKETALAVLDHIEQLTGKGSMDAERAKVMQLGDNPDALRMWAVGHKQDIQPYLPKVGSRDLGGSVQATTTDPLTGKVTVVDTTPKTQTIGEAETARHNRVTEDTANKALNTPGVTYQVDANGNLIALPTKGAPIASPVIGRDGKPVQGNKGLTEVQSNATAFGMRAQAAQDGLTALEQQGIGNPGITAKMVQGLPIIGNTLTPETQQKYNQYKLNFISAVLRKDSGANITKSEIDTEEAKYFPQPGDSQAVIEQKRAARDLAIQALKVQAGSGSRSINGEGGSSLPPVSARHGYSTPQEAYQDYVKAFNAAKAAGNYDMARRITEEARKDGVVK